MYTAISAVVLVTAIIYHIPDISHSCLNVSPVAVTAMLLIPQSCNLTRQLHGTQVIFSDHIHSLQTLALFTATIRYLSDSHYKCLQNADMAIWPSLAGQHT